MGGLLTSQSGQRNLFRQEKKRKIATKMGMTKKSFFIKILF